MRYNKEVMHADESEVKEALEYGAAPSPFGKRKSETIRNPKIASSDSKRGHERLTSESKTQKNSDSKTDHESITSESNAQKNEAHPSTSNTDHESTTSESNTKKMKCPPVLVRQKSSRCSPRIQRM